MKPVKLAIGVLLIALLLPATASAQTPPPDERAAAQAFADAAKRLLAAADAIDGDPGWLEDCGALTRVPERKRAVSEPVVDSLVFRDLVDDLRPDVFRLRSDLANAHTLDAALISGRAALRRLGRAIEALPPGEPDPCAAFEAFADAGYPRSAAREGRALQRRIDALVTRGMQRRIRAAAKRIAELGVSRADADAFAQLAEA